MNKAEFNRMFDTAFDAVSREDSVPPIPDYRPSWEKLQKKLIKSNRTKRTRSKLSKLAVIAAALMLGAFIFGNTDKVRALTPLISTLYESSSGVLSYFFGRADDQDPSKARTAPPPDVAQSSNAGLPVARTVVTDAEGAKEALSFPSPVFAYLPVGYELDNVQVQYLEDRERADSVAYIYLNREGNAIVFSFAKLAEQTALGGNQAKEGIEVKKIELRDGPGILVTASNGSTRLETISRGLMISMSGILPADQVLRVYDEMTF